MRDPRGRLRLQRRLGRRCAREQGCGVGDAGSGGLKRGVLRRLAAAARHPPLRRDLLRHEHISRARPQHCADMSQSRIHSAPSMSTPLLRSLPTSECTCLKARHPGAPGRRSADAPKEGEVQGQQPMSNWRPRKAKQKSRTTCHIKTPPNTTAYESVANRIWSCTTYDSQCGSRGS